MTVYLVCERERSGTHTHTLVQYQLPVYTQTPSALVESKEHFMCLKGVGAARHRERPVSAAQTSWLPSSCAQPVAFGSFRHGGMCMCIFVWVICIGVCHPSGDEQLFYQQGSESFPALTRSPKEKKRKKEGVYLVLLGGR